MATGGVYILGGSLAAMARHHGTHRSLQTSPFSALNVATERCLLDDSIAPGFV